MVRAFESVGIKPWSKYIEYLLRAKQDGAVDLDHYLEAYRDTPTKTPEELCELSGTPQRVIIGNITAQIWDLAHPEASMLMAINHVDIVRTSIDEAKKPEGFRDRKALLEANGVFPLPKTQTVHFHRHVSGKTVEGEAVHTLPDFESDLGDIGEDLPPLLTDGKS